MHLPNLDAEPSVRMRAAIYALPMESPKLQAIAVTPMSNDLAAMLDRAIAASRMVKEERAGRLIEGKANPQSDDAQPLVDDPEPASDIDFCHGG